MCVYIYIYICICTHIYIYMEPGYLTLSLVVVHVTKTRRTPSLPTKIIPAKIA